MSNTDFETFKNYLESSFGNLHTYDSEDEEGALKEVTLETSFHTPNGIEIVVNFDVKEDFTYDEMLRTFREYIANNKEDIDSTIVMYYEIEDFRRNFTLLEAHREFTTAYKYMDFIAERLHHINQLDCAVLTQVDGTHIITKVTDEQKESLLRADNLLVSASSFFDSDLKPEDFYKDFLYNNIHREQTFIESFTPDEFRAIVQLNCTAQEHLRLYKVPNYDDLAEIADYFETDGYYGIDTSGILALSKEILSEDYDYHRLLKAIDREYDHSPEITLIKAFLYAGLFLNLDIHSTEGLNKAAAAIYAYQEDYKLQIYQFVDVMNNDQMYVSSINNLNDYAMNYLYDTLPNEISDFLRANERYFSFQEYGEDKLSENFRVTPFDHGVYFTW